MAEEKRYQCIPKRSVDLITGRDLPNGPIEEVFQRCRGPVVHDGHRFVRVQTYGVFHGTPDTVWAFRKGDANESV